MEILEKPKIETLKSKDINITYQKSTRKSKPYFWFLGIGFLMSVLIFLAIFSENTNENRYKFLENKLLQNQVLNQAERSEFCDLFFKLKGISIENCEKLSTNELKNYINYKATVGFIKNFNYRNNFFEKYNFLKSKQDSIYIHHAIEQSVLKNYPNRFTKEEIHSVENLRGIRIVDNSELHLSKLRREWNVFYKKNPTASREEILHFATYIDLKYGHLFLPKTPKIE